MSSNNRRHGSAAAQQGGKKFWKDYRQLPIAPRLSHLIAVIDRAEFLREYITEVKLKMTFEGRDEATHEEFTPARVFVFSNEIIIALYKTVDPREGKIHAPGPEEFKRETQKIEPFDAHCLQLSTMIMKRVKEDNEDKLVLMEFVNINDGENGPAFHRVDVQFKDAKKLDTIEHSLIRRQIEHFENLKKKIAKENRSNFFKTAAYDINHIQYEIKRLELLLIKDDKKKEEAKLALRDKRPNPTLKLFKLGVDFQEVKAPYTEVSKLKKAFDPYRTDYALYTVFRFYTPPENGIEWIGAKQDVPSAFVDTVTDGSASSRAGACYLDELVAIDNVVIPEQGCTAVREIMSVGPATLTFARRYNVEFGPLMPRPSGQRMDVVIDGKQESKVSIEDWFRHKVKQAPTPQERAVLQLLQELALTEYKYFKTIQGLEDFREYCRQQDEPVFENHDEEWLFMNFADLYGCSQSIINDFYVMLTAMDDNKRPDPKGFTIELVERITDMFAHSEEKFKIFEEYGCYYEYSVHKLEELRRTNPRFDALYRTYHQENDLILDVLSTLQLPLARFPQYNLLLGNLAISMKYFVETLSARRNVYVDQMKDAVFALEIRLMKAKWTKARDAHTSVIESHKHITRLVDESNEELHGWDAIIRAKLNGEKWAYQQLEKWNDEEKQGVEYVETFLCTHAKGAGGSIPKHMVVFSDRILLCTPYQGTLAKISSFTRQMSIGSRSKDSRRESVNSEQQSVPEDQEIKRRRSRWGSIKKGRGSVIESVASNNGEEGKPLKRKGSILRQTFRNRQKQTKQEPQVKIIKLFEKERIINTTVVELSKQKSETEYVVRLVDRVIGRTGRFEDVIHDFATSKEDHRDKMYNALLPLFNLNTPS